MNLTGQRTTSPDPMRSGGPVSGSSVKNGTNATSVSSLSQPVPLSSTSTAHEPAVQTTSITHSTTTVAGRSVSQPEPAPVSQIPQTLGSQTKSNSTAMVAAGLMVSVPGKPIYSQAKGNPVAESMMNMPGQIRQVEAVGAHYGGVNQASHIQPEQQVYNQHPDQIMQNHYPSHGLGGYAATSLSSLSSGGVGPTLRPDLARQNLYASVGPAVPPGSQAGGLLPNPARDSMVSGTPVVSGQQASGYDVNKGTMPPVQMQGQQTTLPTMAGHEFAGMQDFRPLPSRGLSDSDLWIRARARWETNCTAFLHHQHRSMPYLLWNLAIDPSCTFVWKDPNSAQGVIVDIQAHQEGLFEGLGPYLGKLLIDEAENPSYDPVQWCEESRTHVVVNIYSIGLGDPFSL